MRKLKTLLVTIVIMVGATLSLTLLTAAATINTASSDAEDQKGYYTANVTSGNIENYSNEFNQNNFYGTLIIDKATSAIKGSENYSSNFKTATVILRTDTKSDSKYKEGSAETVKTEKASLGKAGTATGATFIVTINDGNGWKTNFLSGYIVYAKKT